MGYMHFTANAQRKSIQNSAVLTGTVLAFGFIIHDILILKLFRSKVFFVWHLGEKPNERDTYCDALLHYCRENNLSDRYITLYAKEFVTNIRIHDKYTDCAIFNLTVATILLKDQKVSKYL